MIKAKTGLIIIALLITAMLAACSTDSTNTTVHADETPRNISDDAPLNQSETVLSLQDEVAKGIDIYANEVGVLEAIEKRAGTRNFADKAIPNDVMARLLWAAHGVTSRDGNVTEHGLDTISSATTKFRYSVPKLNADKFIHVYLIRPEGSYEYIPESQELVLLSDKNLMNVPSSSGNNIQCHILLSIDFDVFKNDREWAAFSVGNSAQNVYLYAASENIGVFAKGMFNDNQIAKELGLDNNNKPYLLMSLGYFKQQP